MVAPIVALASHWGRIGFLLKDEGAERANEDEIDVSLLLSELEVADEAVVVAEAGKGICSAVFPTLTQPGTEASCECCHAKHQTKGECAETWDCEWFVYLADS